MFVGFLSYVVEFVLTLVQNVKTLTLTVVRVSLCCIFSLFSFEGFLFYEQSCWLVLKIGT